MKNKFVIASSLIAASLLQWASAHAQSNMIPISDPRGISPGTGVATIANVANGPDTLQIQVSGLEPNVDHTVFLAASPFIGALPVQYVGMFRTNSSGAGTFSAVTEVNDAYFAANPSMTDRTTGIAPALAGVLANGAFPVPLDWIRIYRAQPTAGGTPTVFSKNGKEAGGIHLLSTLLSFDENARLVANAGPDTTLQAPNFKGDQKSIILDARMSTGAIAKYEWSILTPLTVNFTGDGAGIATAASSTLACQIQPDSPGCLLLRSLSPSQALFSMVGAGQNQVIGGVLTPNAGPLVDFAGRQVTVQVTITDTIGNKTTDTMVISLQ